MKYFLELKIRLGILFFLIFSMSLFSQISKDILQDISGKVTYLNVALPNVNITVNNNKRGIESDKLSD